MTDATDRDPTAPDTDQGSDPDPAPGLDADTEQVTELFAPGRRHAKSTQPNSPLHPRMVLSRVREHMAVQLRAKALPWDDIATHLGITRQSAIESCKRGLANLDRMTEHEVEMLHMQVEQVIADVRTGDLDKDKANVMLKGLGMLAKLKGFEPGQKVEHQHAHAHAHAVVDDVERFQSLLGEVASREVQRRMASLPEPDPDGDLSHDGDPPTTDA